MTIKTRKDVNTEYQRKYRKRRRQEGYVPVNIFIRKVLRDKIAASCVSLQEFVNEAIEARLQFDSDIRTEVRRSLIRTE